MRRKTENEIQDQIVTWLRIEGWIVRRNHVGTFYTRDGRPVSIGEYGECDWRAVRPVCGGPGCLYLEFEAKRPGAKPADHQREYMAKRRRQGVACIWADSLEMFLEKYGEIFNAGA